MIILTAEPQLSLYSYSHHTILIFSPHLQRPGEICFLFAISRLFAGVEAEDEYYRILFIVLKTRLADIGRRIQYSLYSFNIKIKYQPRDL